VEHLRALGCHYGQGYHFAKPSEARDALTLAGPSAASARRGAVAARLGGLSAPASPLPPSAR
jgi:predicted signal transduction protein with EAL and GGDEF domain